MASASKNPKKSDKDGTTISTPTSSKINGQSTKTSFFSELSPNKVENGPLSPKSLKPDQNTVSKIVIPTSSKNSKAINPMPYATADPNSKTNS